MNHADRQRIRAAIDAHVRAERLHIIAMSSGQGRCRTCTSPHEEYTPGCSTCRDRARLRKRRGELGKAA